MAGTEQGGGMNGGESPGGRGQPGSGRPTLMRIGDKVAVVGELLSIQLVASDPENDVLSFSLRSALPEGAKFEKIGACLLGHLLKIKSEAYFSLLKSLMVCLKIKKQLRLECLQPVPKNSFLRRLTR